MAYSPDIPMGDRKIAQLISDQTTETGIAVRAISGGGGGGSVNNTVKVVTGNEARPSAPLVLWVGGTTQPVNMGEFDLWFKQGAVPDTTPPTIPTNLASSNIGETGFTLTWTASTDNEAVTKYEIYTNGTKTSETSQVTANITGLTQNTLYSYTVRAVDAVGNRSNPSAALAVTTLESVTPEPTTLHSIYDGAYPRPVAKTVDAGQPIKVGTAFYATSQHPAGWRIRGVKLWIPAGVSMTGDAVVGLHTAAGLTGPDIINALKATPDRTATLSNLQSGAWNQVLFSTPLPLVNVTGYVASYQFGTTGEYLAAPNTADNPTQSPNDIRFYEAESLIRSAFAYQGGASNTSNGWWGLDLIIDEGA